jgi:hypothetical protein
MKVSGTFSAARLLGPSERLPKFRIGFIRLPLSTSTERAMKLNEVIASGSVPSSGRYCSKARAPSQGKSTARTAEA